ncbi:four-carbon acid sugar kinase family protein [Cupriavidus pauculus]|uniref:four-carbon acid sugar kinase family protein n=1 Tax=Cupriavidus pauculus TaxID=82633 RepID=UPI001EE37E87|nr:four-carbon acid sugar kinase family protein [Cupriavidus pauculus]GJG97672.1 four-carbon acid sugar kinase family protein [Cupriavidus pauculus]
MNLLILADDLTGAADCAIGFASTGHNTFVVVQPDVAQNVPSDGLLAVDTDTRRLSPNEAAQRTASVYQAMSSSGHRLYKKIDSTLRGNWAVEVARLVSVAGVAIVAPAHPAMGRTVKDGCVFLRGQPLEQSDTWQLEHGHLSANIAVQLEDAGLKVAMLQVDAKRDNPGTLALRIGEIVGQDLDALVLGAESTEDLRFIALATLGVDRPTFWVGSGGLAREISELVPGRSTSGFEIPPRQTGPILILAGSLSRTTGRQIDRLMGQPGIATFVVPPHVLRGGAMLEAWTTLQDRIEEVLGGDVDVLLKIGLDDDFDPCEGAALSTALARLTARYFPRIGGLIATGGETARAMLVEAGVHRLRILDELEPGVVVGVPVGAGVPAPFVVTKAGAFGNDDTLLEAWAALRKANSEKVKVSRQSV